MGYKRKETENMENLLTNGKEKFVKYDKGAAMFSMGIHSFMDLAKEAKAVYRIRINVNRKRASIAETCYKSAKKVL